MPHLTHEIVYKTNNVLKMYGIENKYKLSTNLILHEMCSYCHLISTNIVNSINIILKKCK